MAVNLPGQTVAPIPGHSLWKLGRPGNAVTLGHSKWRVALQVGGKFDFSADFSRDFAAFGSGQTVTTVPKSLWHLGKPGNAVLLTQSFWSIADHMPPIPLFADLPPVIARVATSSVSSSSQTITWMTDAPSDSQVDYVPA